MIARTLLNPVDKMTIVMQVRPISWGAVLCTFKREGVRSMWQGATVNALRVGIFGATVSVGYAHGLTLNSFAEYDPWEPVWRGAVGAIASLFGTILTHPLDVVRTRITLQTQLQRHTTYTGIWHALQTISTQEGDRSLYHSLTPACYSVVLEVFVQLDFMILACTNCQRGLGSSLRRHSSRRAESSWAAPRRSTSTL